MIDKTCFEICAGAGGQALGLHRAGFRHLALVEYESAFCDTLRANMPMWNVICQDVRFLDGTPYRDKVDLFAGGVPCPPFSVASRQLGMADERDLFPEAIRLIGEIRPRAFMLENVRGFLAPKFNSYRDEILLKLDSYGYRIKMELLYASDYGVPQLRPKVVIVGIAKSISAPFSYPPKCKEPPHVGDVLRDIMGRNGWRQAQSWADRARGIAPTLVGGSKKHGGPDLGPTRARKAWAALGVDGLGIANQPPEKDFMGMPRLTKEMLALIQGFPLEWNFGSVKTTACKMIGNAFPPPVAEAVGRKIMECLNG